MKRFRNPAVLLRVLLPLLVVPFLGLAARSHELTQRLHEAGRAWQFASPAGLALRLAQVAELQPWRSGLWEQAGIYALQGGDAQAALGYLQRAAARQLLSPAGYLALGDAHRQAGELEQALSAWQSAMPGVEAGVVYDRLLETHRQLGDADAVVADLKALTALRPADVDLRYQLGLHLAAQEPLSALPHLAQVGDLDPDLQPAAQALVSSIRTASLADDPAYTLLESGRTLASLGEWRLAAEAFRRSAQLRPEYADAWAFLGEALQHPTPEAGESSPGQGDAGLEALQKALELDPDSLVANTLLALYWQRQGELARARTYLENVTRLYPDNPSLHAELGSTLALLGELDAARQAYQQAVEIAPASADAWRLLAGFSARYEYQLRQLGLPAARQAAALEKNDPANPDMLGQVLLLLGDLTSAERAFLSALEVDQNYSLARVHLGLVYILQGNAQGARQEWQSVLSRAPDSAAAEQAQRLMHNYFP